MRCWRYLPGVSQCLLGLICVWPEAATAQSASLLRLVDGQTIEGKLTHVDDRGNAKLVTNGQSQTIDMRDIVFWGNYVDNDRDGQVFLTDGSILVGELASVGANKLIITTGLCGELELARDAVCGIAFQPAAKPLERDRQADQMRLNDTRWDLIRLVNGDELVGRLESGESDARESLIFVLPNGGQKLPLAAEGLVSMTAARTESAPEKAPQSYLGFLDGTLLATESTIGNDIGFELKTPAGVIARIASKDFQDRVCFYQPHSPAVVYVSDLPSLGYKHIPFLELDWPLGVDHNVLGGRLRSSSRVCLKGLGMHSTSRVAYDLKGQYRRFDAELALDAQSGTNGSVVCRVLVETPSGADGSTAWSVASTSPVIRGGQAEVPITVDVSGASRMALIVDFADRGDVLDHANWLNARLVK